MTNVAGVRGKSKSLQMKKQSRYKFFALVLPPILFNLLCDIDPLTITGQQISLK
jgi:hypothetical protein